MDTDMLCLSSSLQLLFIDRGLGRGEKYTKDEFFISGIGFLHFPYSRKIQGMKYYLGS
jgi:hypothetical protein